MNIDNFIIPNWDSRFGKLGHMWKKFSYDDLWKYSSNGSLYYLIPKELILVEYTTAKISILKSKDNWVSCYSINRILNITCNLTNQEYFDLLILKINDKSNRPKCKNCKSLLQWSNRITHGYSGLDFTISINTFCSTECSCLYRESHPDEYVNFHKAKNLLFSNGGPLKYTMINDPDTYIAMQIEANRSRFNNSGNVMDICYLYVTWTYSGKLKFGISDDVDNRQSWSGFNDYYINPHILKMGLRYDISNLETLIKYHFNQFNEYLYKPSDLIEFWKFIKTIL